MLQVARWRVILVLIVTALGIIFAVPNVLPQNVRESLPPFMQRSINLGLDLRGGSQLLLEVDVEELRSQQLDNVADQMVAALRDAEPRITYTGRGVVGDAARVRLVNPAEDSARAMELLQAIARSPQSTDPIYRYTQSPDGLIEARITEQYLSALSRQAAQQSIEVIRDRIDPTGTSEVSIARQGDRRIVVQAPGVSDPEQLKERIGQTALMTFHLVREVSPDEAAQGRLPPGTMLVGPYGTIGQSQEIVERRARLTGEHLVRANPSTDGRTGEFVMSFQLDSQGARIFCRITTEYVNQRFAILLDNQVLTAPRINEPICGGSGQISGNFTAASASELSLMLNAGALPVPLTVIEERTVDASLGQDAIESGALASVVAGLVTLVFMVLAYGLFGVFAVVALIVNFVLLLGAMSMVGAALTLPGIAGLILTIAMAVDANVIIYERMREEAAAGRGPALAIDAGFGRAMVTIIDANLTTILAALILFQFGAGPVRGFAWTLSIGVITSVFTAVLVTQVLIAWWFRLARPKQLPI
jgi:preprotein translocase subunit SecD